MDLFKLEIAKKWCKLIFNIFILLLLYHTDKNGTSDEKYANEFHFVSCQGPRLLVLLL